METIKREIEDSVISHLKPGKAVLVFGARRVGKTVLTRKIIREYKGDSILLNGEDYDAEKVLEERSGANYSRLFQNISLLAIDEAQAIPDIGRIIKFILDEIPSLSVIATGSSSFDLRKNAGEPLVGRSTSFILTPFSQSELSKVENPMQTRQNLEARLIFGSYPDAVALENDEERKDYLREIVNAYLMKDILSFDGIRSSRKMLDLLRLIAFQIGSEVSLEEIGKQLGINKLTVEKYLDLLEKTFVIFRVGSFSGNLRKEIVKAGKYFFYDSGIRNALIRDYRPMAIRNDAGAIWENYIISERQKRNLFSRNGNILCFWRTYTGQEIDLIEQSENGHIRAYEIKWDKKIPLAPKSFREAYPDAEYSVINKENYLDFI